MDEARIIAWIDGELSPEEARKVAAAVAADPALAARADQHRRIKARFHKAFGGIIEEAGRMPVKARAADVVPIAAARARRDAARPRPDPAPKRNWAMPAAVAASLALGIAIGLQVRPLPGVADQPHALMLNGAMADALDSLPSGAPGPVRISLSFRAQAGGWCRSFAATHLSGIACRTHDGGWQLRYANPSDAQPGVGAGLGRAIDTMIAGAPADAAQERQAIATGWR